MELDEIREIIKNYISSHTGKQLHSNLYGFIEASLKEDGLSSETSQLFKKLKANRSPNSLKDFFNKMLLSPEELNRAKDRGSRTLYIRPLHTHDSNRDLFFFNIYYLKFLANIVGGNNPLLAVLRHTMTQYISYPENTFIFPLSKDLPWMSIESFSELFQKLSPPHVYVPLSIMEDIERYRKKSLFKYVTKSSYQALVNETEYLQKDHLAKKRLKAAKLNFYRALASIYNLSAGLRWLFTSRGKNIISDQDNRDFAPKSFKDNAQKYLSEKSQANRISLVGCVEEYEQNACLYIASDEDRREDNAPSERMIKIQQELELNILTLMALSKQKPQKLLLENLRESTLSYLKAIEAFHYHRAKTFLTQAEDSKSPELQQIQKEITKHTFWKKAKNAPDI